MTLLKRKAVTGLFCEASTAGQKAAAIRGFLRQHRHNQDRNDDKAEWLLEHSALAAKEQHLEAQLQSVLDDLLQTDAISAQEHEACTDEATLLQQLRFEDAAESKEAVQQLRLAVKACHPHVHGDVHATNQHGALQDLYAELQAEMQLQQRHLCLLQEDVQCLGQHMQCALLPLL